ncbi:alpha-N-acetylneuraminate alpha-2,8-sialyltransferase ST8SIA3-like [Saccoglossus kowalevskii]
MRTNIQAILQFQHDAGRRSNLTTMNPDCWERFGLLTSKRNKSIMFLNATKEYEGYMMWVPNSPRIPNQFAFTTHELLRESTNLTLLIANAKYFEHIQQLWKLKKPLSPGMMLVAMAISLCDELHLYGFWPFTVVDANGLHLHNDNSDDKYWSAFHSFSDYSAEFRLLASLHKQGLFKLHVDKCS